MRMLCVAALLGLLSYQIAYAADGSTAAAPKAAKAQTAAKPSAAGAAEGQGIPKSINMSQQDRMRMCSKQATGKKGAERKAFMKSCLSTKKS